MALLKSFNSCHYLPNIRIFRESLLIELMCKNRDPRFKPVIIPITLRYRQAFDQDMPKGRSWCQRLGQFCDWYRSWGHKGQLTIFKFEASSFCHLLAGDISPQILKYYIIKNACKGWVVSQVSYWYNGQTDRRWSIKVLRSFLAPCRLSLIMDKLVEFFPSSHLHAVTGAKNYRYHGVTLAGLFFF